ncbi:unnamed protein product, partial [Sphacelaria rigidula]
VGGSLAVGVAEIDRLKSTQRRERVGGRRYTVRPRGLYSLFLSCVGLNNATSCTPHCGKTGGRAGRHNCAEYGYCCAVLVLTKPFNHSRGEEER